MVKNPVFWWSFVVQI